MAGGFAQHPGHLTDVHCARTTATADVINAKIARFDGEFGHLVAGSSSLVRDGPERRWYR